jgi:hypothetical protein
MAQVDLAGRIEAVSRDRTAQEADRRRADHTVAAMGRLAGLAEVEDTREGSWA